MKIKVLFILLLVNLCSLNGYSQKRALEKADKDYENYAYIDAAKIYESIAKKGYKDKTMFEKLGNAYYFNSDFENSAKWYGELFLMNSEPIEADYYYRYAQSLKSIGDYKKANEMLTAFNQKKAEDLRAKKYAAETTYLDKIKENSGRYTVNDAGINSPLSDFGSAFCNNKLVFTSSRDTGGFFKRRIKWTNQPFTNLYAAEIKADSTIASPQKFSTKLSTRVNESSAVFTKDGKMMYFTRNNFDEGPGKTRKDSKRVTLLKLYSARFKNNEWTDVKELPFNSDQYSVAHPALSPDEKTLYFASDMPGTFGQSDLFKVSISNDSIYSAPENLGKSINTEGKETFPFVTDENDMYFATDGHQGLGGLDIFVAKINDDGTFTQIKNVGEPVNSKFDDFAFLIDTKSHNGFFTSNRPDGKGYDDIYKFKETKKLKCEQLIEGNITDVDTNLPIADAQVVLYDENMVKVKTMTSDAKGYYNFGIVPCDYKFFIRVEKKDYETNEIPTGTSDTNGKTNVPVPLKKNIIAIKPGVNLAAKEVLNITIIYFNLDKADIRGNAAFELEKILAVMNQYPNLKLDVRSHTDSRQSHKYNQDLSDRRAKSTIAWLIAHGIAPARLTGRGYGETQLVNKCADGVKCTEEEHQMNRRSEFIITSM